MGAEEREVVQYKRSHSWIDRLVVCRECGHVAGDSSRHSQHLKEARHINHLRSMAYKEPTRRAFWLKVWYSSIEKVESDDPWALAFDESQELPRSFDEEEVTRTL